GAHRRIETDDLALAERLHALDGAPLADRIDLQRPLLQPGFFPAFGEILHAPGNAPGIVFVILDLQALGGEETLLDGDAPGSVVGITIALDSDNPGHAAFLRSGARGISAAGPPNSTQFTSQAIEYCA